MSWGWRTKPRSVVKTVQWFKYFSKLENKNWEEKTEQLDIRGKAIHPVRREYVYNAHKDEDENLDIVIERRKKFDMKPMSPEEAVLQMELIEHGFYMFRNIDSDEISIVYKREDGGYGLIEHE